MKELGLETLKIASDVNEAANFKREKDRKLAELKETNRQFDHTRRWLAVNSHLQRLFIYNEFERSGIDARELKVLFDTTMDISIANGVKFSVAFDKFIEDVRERKES
jgi:predicted outer membrane protein